MRNSNANRVSTLFQRAAASLAQIPLHRLALALIVAGVAARGVRYGLGFPLWGDEAFVAVDFLIRDFADMIRPLTYHQIVPLLFMWAQLAITRVLGLSEWALRLLPFLAGVAALPLLWTFAATTLNRRIALLSLAFLAAAYYPIRHGAEVKPYATDLLISVLLLSLGWASARTPRATWRWMTLTVFAATAVWASYPAVFVAGGIAVLLAMRAWKDRSPAVFAGFGVYAAALAGSWLTMFLIYAEPHAKAVPAIFETEMWLRAFPPAHPLRLVVWLVLEHAGNMMAYPVGGRNGGSAITLVLVIIGVAALWRRKRRDLLVLLLVPLALNMIAAALHKYPYAGSARTMLYAAPIICLLAGAGLYAALQRATRGEWRVYRRPALRIVVIVFIGVAMGSIVRDAIEPYKKLANYEARRVVREFTQQVSRDDQIIAFHATDESITYAPFLAPWKGDGAQLVFYLTRHAPVEIRWAPPAEAAVAGAVGHRRTWFVFFGGFEFLTKYEGYRSFKGPEYADAHPPLERQLASYRDTLIAALGVPVRELHVIERRFLRLSRTEREWKVTQELTIERFGEK